MSNLAELVKNLYSGCSLGLDQSRTIMIFNVFLPLKNLIKSACQDEHKNKSGVSVFFLVDLNLLFIFL